MSTTYDIVCDKCRTKYWLGQSDYIYQPEILMVFFKKHIGHDMRFLCDLAEDEQSFGYVEWRQPVPEGK